MSVTTEISELLQQGRAKLVKQKVTEALDAGIPAKEILEEGLLAGMGVVGEKFKNNEVFVPEVLVAARAMNAGIDILKPYLADSGVESKGTAVIGTVKGDLHDIGKNLVKLMLEGKGLRVVDLGVDVTPEAYIDAAVRENAEIICCSALLTTTMAEMKNVVDLLNERGLHDKIKVMVGGAPVTQAFCDTIGADCFTSDAASAADAAVALCSAAGAAE